MVLRSISLILAYLSFSAAYNGNGDVFSGLISTAIAIEILRTISALTTVKEK